MSAATYNTCGVTLTGGGTCWGFLYGYPPGGMSWRSMGDGLVASCGVTTSNNGYCWGSSVFSQLNVPSGKSWKSMEASGQNACGVTTAGEGYCWAWDVWRVPEGRTWASIHPGEAFNACGVTTSGEGICWGANPYYGMTDVPAGKTWSMIDPGSSHVCGITTSGEGVCWGNSYDGRTDIPADKTWANISVGDLASCGVTTDGDGYCWGNNSYGIKNIPSGHKWKSFSVGQYHTCGITDRTEMVCWGQNSYDQLDVPATGISEPDAPTVSPAPASPTKSTSAEFTISGSSEESPLEYLCSSDDIHYSACDSSHSVTGLSEGTANLYVKSRDAIGLIGPATHRSWTIDLTAPGLPSVTAPSSPSRESSPSIGFTTAESGGSTACRLDGGDYSPCSSPVTLNDLGEGTHTIEVQQTDEAGNVGAAASATWTVDTAAPSAPALSGAPSGSTTSTGANISFTGEAGATFTCSLDDEAPAACTSPRALSGLSLGSHTFSVMATDAAGNTSAAASATWTVTAPAPPVSGPAVLTPPSGAKTLIRNTAARSWTIKVNLLFSMGGDTRPGASFLTLQVAVDSNGKPLSAKPADGASFPTAAKIRQGVVAWDPTKDGATLHWASTPVWVRVQNRVGLWSNWAQLKQ